MTKKWHGVAPIDRSLPTISAKEYEIMGYGPRTDFKTYKKIDLYSKGTYLCSSKAYRTCREFKERYAKLHDLDPKELKAYFSERQ